MMNRQSKSKAQQQQRGFQRQVSERTGARTNILNHRPNFRPDLVRCNDRSFAMQVLMRGEEKRSVSVKVRRSMLADDAGDDDDDGKESLGERVE